LGWFRYWATEHDYERTISSIKYGGLIQRTEPYHLPIGASNKRRGKKKHGDVLYTPAERAMMAQQKGLADQDQDQARPELTEEEPITHSLAGFNVAPSTKREEDEPDVWASEFLVVEDPFIFLKNVAARVPRTTVLRFKAECERSMFILEAGQSISKTLGSPEDQQKFALNAGEV